MAKKPGFPLSGDSFSSGAERRGELPSANNPACPKAGTVKAGGRGPKKTAYRGQGDGKTKAVQMNAAD